uniref:Uncharacterized protein n=1 Tax=Xenopus tropicalis TaxID=8364 RepID=A0A803K693_XENTR
MSTPPGFYADPLDLFACMDYSWTPEIPTDPRERTLFWLRCESLGLSGDEGLAYGVGQLVAGEADLEDGYYVLQRTMHQPGGRYWHSPYTVLPLPCSLAEWHGQWERLNFCDYSTFVGNPEGEFHTLYAQRFFYIGMNDTEERREWLADLVYQELELIKDAGVGEEQEASQTTLFCGCVTPGLAEPESGCCHFKGLAEAEASPSEIPVCMESSGCVTPGLVEPESGCCHFKGLAEAEASPSEIPVCMESSGCVAPGLVEPESGCCHFKGLAEAEASPSEIPVCMESSGCVTPGLAEPESGCCHFKGLAEAEASPSEIPVCMESSGCVTPVLAEPESGCCHFKGLAEAEASPSENPVCLEFSGCVTPGLAEPESRCCHFKNEDSPLPELLLAGEEQDQEEIVPETPSGRQQGTGALREVGWNLELKKRQGDKHLSNTLWGPLVIGVT